MRSIMTVAQVTCLSALARRESRGSHFRSDYPESNDHDWLCNVLIRQGSQGRAEVWQEGVEFTRMRPERGTVSSRAVNGPCGRRVRRTGCGAPQAASRQRAAPGAT